ncbi:unnamed protein product [Albugo candida]|uniref:Uncharacterized protein n=1 Tax=Albugo candida TaxID=65357 RepID=A0A024GA54_9STRA|nr:unnamed protein product [Albugo candida]|eukprot:CCI43380.1 unnamed protein product [Albugo candida]
MFVLDNGSALYNVIDSNTPTSLVVDMELNQFHPRVTPKQFNDETVVVVSNKKKILHPTSRNGRLSNAFCSR